MGKNKKGGSKKFVSEVYPSMIRDVVSTIAQADPPIVALGEEWLTSEIWLLTMTKKS
jgi:hypothetical protein